MNAVGIDISKGKSTVSVMRPFGEIAIAPFEIEHTEEGLQRLIGQLQHLSGETKVIMEYTSTYYQPVANALHHAGFFVSVIHPMLIHRYGHDSIRKAKTDRLDAIKIACYGLDRWLELQRYMPEEDTRQLLKAFNRQYGQLMKLKVALQNNLLNLIDRTFPGINNLFVCHPRQDGHEKWLDFVLSFWHAQCVSVLSFVDFSKAYGDWCKSYGYRQTKASTEKIYAAATCCISTLPLNTHTEKLIKREAEQLAAMIETLFCIMQEMRQLAATLPEYPIVIAMNGVGNTLTSQLIAEIGDVRRFRNKQALVAFAGLDSPPYQSGTYEAKGYSISKRGSPSLRKALFQIMVCLLQCRLVDAVYQFLQKKRGEGKHYYVYMIAGANKFLRIYYARVKEYLVTQEALQTDIPRFFEPEGA